MLAGEVYVPPLLTEMSALPGPRSLLIQRQMEVPEAIGGGLSNKDIGARLDLSEKTVKVHITAIFKALNVVKRTQAMRCHAHTRPRSRTATCHGGFAPAIPSAPRAKPVTRKSSDK